MNASMSTHRCSLSFRCSRCSFLLSPLPLVQRSKVASNTVNTWTTATSFAPNNYNFPSHDLTTGANLPHNDLEALMTGAYGSSPGCLCTYPNEVRADMCERVGSSALMCAVVAVCVPHAYSVAGQGSEVARCKQPVGTSIMTDTLFLCLAIHEQVVKGKQVAQIATTIARPDRGYSGTCVSGPGCSP